MRTRKQCTECFYIIRLKRKNPEKYYEDNPNYKKCNKCEEWKTLDEYYFKDGRLHFAKCKECIKEKDRTDRRINREKELEEGCGSERINHKPNVYRDKYQRSCTFWIMETLGYIYNDEFGIWTKPGWKEIAENGKVVFPKIISSRKKTNPYPINGKKPDVNVTPEKYEMLFELRAKGYTYEKIGKELDLSITTVCKWLKEVRVPRWKDTSK
jgi:hypothetical protein